MNKSRDELEDEVRFLRKRNFFIRKVFLGGSMIILVAIAAAYLYLSPQKESENIVASYAQVGQPIAPPDYGSFMGVWNSIARSVDLPDAHKLLVNNSQEQKKFLRLYFTFYSSEMNPSLGAELKILADKYPKLLWRYYRDFLVTHLGKHRITEDDWNAVSSSDDLRALVKKLTAQKNVDESIKQLLAASDPCAYFDIYKYDLWKRGLSKSVDACNAFDLDSKQYSEIISRIKR